MRKTVVKLSVYGASLALLWMLAACSTVKGMGQDLQDGSDAVRGVLTGDDADAPPND